jgi:hypothetical protein
MGIPTTSSRSNHAIAIRVNGVTIGRIQTWAPNQSRTVTPVYELNADNPLARGGAIIENVPGNLTGMTITVTRYDLYSSKFEEVWGPSFSISLLTDQDVGLQIVEHWSNPDNTSEDYLYEDCWFTSLGRNHAVQGDRIVMVNGTLQYARVKKIR